jgi:hypothetical protein
MGREHNTAAGITYAAGSLPAVQKHKERTRNGVQDGVLPAGSVARHIVLRSKYRIVYERTENMDKEKKLEIDVSTIPPWLSSTLC